MTIFAKSVALAAAFAASTALAQTAPQTAPAKPDAAPPAGQVRCPNGQMMAQGAMMSGRQGRHMGAAAGPNGQSGAVGPGKMMGRAGVHCVQQASAAPEPKSGDGAAPKTK